jgi:hypothetical protein
MADLREVIVPLCKIVEVSGGGGGGGGLNHKRIPLMNTSIGLQSLSMTDTSGFALGTSSFTASGGYVAGTKVQTSATFDIVTTRKNSSELESKVVITNPGIYNRVPAASGLEFNGVLSTGTSAVFTGVMESGYAAAPYISVTDLSGATGFFRVIPSKGASGNDYVASAFNNLHANNCVCSIDVCAVGANASGMLGVIAPAGGTAVLTLPPHLAATEIIIENAQPLTTNLYAINYGVVKRATALRDQQLPDVK